jgi:hypothetical protein
MANKFSGGQGLVDARVRGWTYELAADMVSRLTEVAKQFASCGCYHLMAFNYISAEHG